MTTEKSQPKKTASAKRTERRVVPSEIAADAVRQLAELTGREPEGATGLERTDDGWKVSVDVLELRRVPSTTDVLANYDVEVDERGHLLGYRRRQRYVRGTAGEE